MSPRRVGERPFCRQSRLRTRAQIAHLRAHGDDVVGRLCIVRALMPPPDERRRVGIVVSRRFSGKAVVRNRARRLLREAYRQVHPELEPAWVMLIPRRAIQKTNIHYVVPELRRLCRRLSILQQCPTPE